MTYRIRGLAILLCLFPSAAQAHSIPGWVGFALLGTPLLGLVSLVLFLALPTRKGGWLVAAALFALTAGMTAFVAPGISWFVSFLAGYLNLLAVSAFLLRHLDLHRSTRRSILANPERPPAKR